MTIETLEAAKKIEDKMKLYKEALAYISSEGVDDMPALKTGLNNYAIPEIVSLHKRVREELKYIYEKKVSELQKEFNSLQ